MKINTDDNLTSRHIEAGVYANNSEIANVVRGLEHERDMWRDRVKDVEDTLRTARLDELSKIKEGLIELVLQRDTTAPIILEWVEDRINEVKK